MSATGFQEFLTRDSFIAFLEAGITVKSVSETDLHWNLSNYNPGASAGFIYNDTDATLSHSGQTVAGRSIYFAGYTVAISEVSGLAGTTFDDFYFVGSAGDDYVVSDWTTFTGGIEFQWSIGDDFFQGMANHTAMIFVSWDQDNGWEDTFGIGIDYEVPADMTSQATFTGGIYGDTVLDAQPDTIYGTPLADTLIGNSSDNYFRGIGGDDFIRARGGDDEIRLGLGTQTALLGSGADIAIVNWWGPDGANAASSMVTIGVESDGTWERWYYAHNTDTEDGGIGTGKLVSLVGYNKSSDFILNQTDVDITISLWKQNNDPSPGGFAFFIEDKYSAFNTRKDYVVDRYLGSPVVEGQRVVTDDAYKPDLTVMGTGEADIIDLTSGSVDTLNDFSSISVWAGPGADILWGSDQGEAIYGQEGDDIIFGGKGNDYLWGGIGSDIFEFTATSGNDYIDDFNKDDDQLHFYYRDGEAEQSAATSISNGIVTWGLVTIDLNDATLDLSDLTITYEMI